MCFRRKNNCLTSFGPSYNPNALGPYSSKLPGELYTADQQCERVFGSGSSMCRVSMLEIFSKGSVRKKFEKLGVQTFFV